MPVFIRPARVVVDEGASPAAVIAGVIVVAIVISGAAAIIADLVTALLILAAVAVAGSLTVLILVLRRTGMAVAVDHRPAPGEPRPVAAIPETTERRAI